MMESFAVSLSASDTADDVARNAAFLVSWITKALPCISSEFRTSGKNRDPILTRMPA